MPITNLSLNKIAYFLHGAYLVQHKKPLINARIEAWEYGPVIREIYHEFKHYNNRPIGSRARTINRVTGEKETCSYSFTPDELILLEPLVLSYAKLRPGTLVELSHVHDGPWFEVWFHQGRVNPGMEISNQLIEEFFSSQMRH